MNGPTKTGQSTKNRSEHDSAIPTPRNLNTRNVNGMAVGGSGTLPDSKKSMDSMVSQNKTTELLQRAQASAQSQQFKTVEDSKKTLD